MFENGKFPTIEELLERGEHLIQKAVDGKRLSGEETHFLELQNIWLAQRRDEQEKNCVRPLVEQLKKTNPFVQDVFRSTEYSEFALWCIEIPTTASRHNEDGKRHLRLLDYGRQQHDLRGDVSPSGRSEDESRYSGSLHHAKYR